MPNITDLFKLCKNRMLSTKIINEFILEWCKQKVDITTILNSRDEDNNNLLHLLCIYQPENKAAIRYLNKFMRKQHTTNNDGYTPLQLSMNSFIKARCSDKEIVETGELLVAHGANADDTDEFGVSFSSIEAVVKYAHISIIVESNKEKHLEKTLYNILLEEMWNTETVYFLLQKGVALNSVDSNGNSPLHLACDIFTYKIDNLRNIKILRKEQETLRLLIRNGTDPNFLNKDKKLPLHIYCKQTLISFPIARWLIENTTDLTAQDIFNKTPLHYLCESFSEVKHEDYHAMSIMLYIEFLTKNKQITIALIDLLFTINISLMRASVYNKKSLVDIFNEYKDSKANFFVLEKLCERTNLNYQTIKSYCQERNDNVQKKVSKCLSYLDTSDISKGRNILHLICGYGTDSEIFDLIFKAGGKPNVPDESGNTPLHILCAYESVNNENLLKTLFANKVVANSKNKLGKTSLDYLLSNTNVSFNKLNTLLKIFFCNGADLHAKKPYAQTPFAKYLAHCNQYNDFSMAKLFLYNLPLSLKKQIPEVHLQKINEAQIKVTKEDHNLLPKELQNKLFTLYCCMWKVNKKVTEEKKVTFIPKPIQSHISNMVILDMLKEKQYEQNNSFCVMF